MNMHLTASKAIYKATLPAQGDKLMQLPASSIMKHTGDIFDPAYYLLDEQAGLVYRKEIFDYDGLLPSEILVVDKRYTEQEIRLLCHELNLEVLELHYFSASKWGIDLEQNVGKEIVVVVKKTVIT